MHTVNAVKSLVVLPAIYIANRRGLMSFLTVICTLPKGQKPGFKEDHTWTES